jgi:hypothetical protein
MESRRSLWGRSGASAVVRAKYEAAEDTSSERVKDIVHGGMNDATCQFSPVCSRSQSQNSRGLKASKIFWESYTCAKYQETRRNKIRLDHTASVIGLPFRLDVTSTKSGLPLVETVRLNCPLPSLFMACGPTLSAPIIVRKS